MSMRTLECNHCGEPLTGHDDDALARRLLDHVKKSHPDAGLSDEEAREQVGEEAYTATDN